MHPPRRTPWLLLALLALPMGCTCRPGQTIEPTTSRLRFEVPTPSVTRSLTPTLSFDQQYADAADHPLKATLVNEGEVTLTLTSSGVSAPFTVDLPTRIAPGAIDVVVHFTPVGAGAFEQLLQVQAAGTDGATLALSAKAVAIPVCTASAVCRAAHFNLTLGKCVEDPIEDGTACDPGTKCVLGATCQSGRCVGTPLSCDDGDACTVDVCQAELGCEHVPRPPCPGDGVCQVGICDPKRGCGFAPADDGTQCGALQSCSAAQVCLNGACVVRDPPDGYICEEASPCRDQGRCVGDRCVHTDPTVKTLAPSWSFDSATPTDLDAGTSAPYHDFVLEPGGQVSLSNFFAAPVRVRANTTQAMDAPAGAARRCLVWNGKLVCADYPANPNGSVSAIDPATGQTAWTFDIHPNRPDFVALTKTIFLARLVVQGGDRLAALYESYPAGSPDNTQCRRYFLVVMDAKGQLVMSQRVQDPLLDVCNHPHPYGVASDAVGNLYIAFSPTRSPQAPLLPDSPTLLISYTHDGLFRWKRLESTIRGGELAVARGLLYPENSSVVLDAPTGQPAYAVSSTLGRVVISADRLIPAPVTGGNQLLGYEAGLTSLRWQHQLDPGWTFWGEQLRLASWSTTRGERTVALSFVADANLAHYLHAVDTFTGAEAFTCPVDLPARTEPQLFEVANGKLAVMEGGLDAAGQPGCVKCDPPLAGSHAAFQVLDLPGVTIAAEPWVGTFGGAGHPHHEN